jgi:FHA domain-containing protein
MIRCNNCGTNNIDGSEYCDECGMKLDLAAQSRGRANAYQPPSAVENEPMSPNTSEGPPIAPPSFTTSTSIPKPAMPARERKPENRGQQSPDGNSNKGRNVTGERRMFNSSPREAHRPNPQPDSSRANGPSQTFALSSRAHTDPMEADYPSSDNPRVTARLIIERGGRVGREFTITGIETNIGRWDADSGIFPDVDLDEDDPEAKISRRHARIINHNGQYFIEDLGSTNGTFVNRGRRLLPGKRHMLQNGDEIIVGKTFLKFQILR